MLEEPSMIGNREGGPPLVQVPEPKLSPPSLEAGQTAVAAASHHGAEPIPALVKTVAVLNGAETPQLAATETGSGANVDLSTSLLRSPVSDHGPSDPDFPLFVDLGPEPSLSEGLSRPKPRSVVNFPASATLTATLMRRLTSFWLWVIGRARHNGRGTCRVAGSGQAVWYHSRQAGAGIGLEPWCQTQVKRQVQSIENDREDRASHRRSSRG